MKEFEYRSPSCSTLSLCVWFLSIFLMFSRKGGRDGHATHSVYLLRRIRYTTCDPWLSQLYVIIIPRCNTHYLLDTIFFARNKSWVCFNFNFCNLFSNAMVNCCEKAMAFFLCSLDNCSDLVL